MYKVESVDWKVAGIYGKKQTKPGQLVKAYFEVDLMGRAHSQVRKLASVGVPARWELWWLRRQELS